jgi:diguanylate cyclase (GGDEF)-like protein
MRGDETQYAKAAVRFVALDEMMEQENKMIVKNMIGLRLELNELAIVNHQIEEQNRSLQIRSQTDPLTGMYNRLRLNSYGETAFERAEKNQVGLAVEILDIDFFKEYNDNYGHQAGDKVIQFIAASIKKMQAGNRVFAARYGGDEFVLIYEGYTDEEVFALAKKLKKIITMERMPHRYSRTETKYVTISQGMYWGIPKKGTSIWQYLHEADNMLYKVKRKSRNSIMLGHANEEELKRGSDYLDRNNLVVLSATDEEN